MKSVYLYSDDRGFHPLGTFSGELKAIILEQRSWYGGDAIVTTHSGNTLQYYDVWWPQFCFQKEKFIFGSCFDSFQELQLTPRRQGINNKLLLSNGLVGWTYPRKLNKHLDIRNQIDIVDY